MRTGQRTICTTVRFTSSDLRLPQIVGDTSLVFLNLSWLPSGETLVHSLHWQLWQSVVGSVIECVEDRVPEYHRETANSSVTHIRSMAEAREYSDRGLGNCTTPTGCEVGFTKEALKALGKIYASGATWPGLVKKEKTGQ